MDASKFQRVTFFIIAPVPTTLDSVCLEFLVGMVDVFHEPLTFIYVGVFYTRAAPQLLTWS